MSQAWEKPGTDVYMPPIVIDPATGADYDTLLSLLSDWVVRVCLIDDDGRDHVGRVEYKCGDDIHLVAFDSEPIDEKIPLSNVRWIQVL